MIEVAQRSAPHLKRFPRSAETQGRRGSTPVDIDARGPPQQPCWRGTALWRLSANLVHKRGQIARRRVRAPTRDGRTELVIILDFIRPGDTLVVKLDRLGRSTRDVLNLVHELESKGAHLRVLEPEVSTKGPVGKMVLTVLGMVAEMEVGFIRERQRAGIEAAKARGVYKGRPVTLDHAKIIDLHKKRNGATAIAKGHRMLSWCSL
jgi:DNA invertase Pin-like site-specific DNA recombinase